VNLSQVDLDDVACHSCYFSTALSFFFLRINQITFDPKP